MSFSKQASEYDGEIMTTSMRKYLDDLSFERKHPFLTEWKEWHQVVHTYHSDVVVELSKAINRGRRGPSILAHVPEFCWLIDEIFWQSFEIMGDMIDGVPFGTLWKKKTMKEVAVPIYLGCSCYEDDCTEWNTNCKYKELHLKSKVISFLWAYSFVHPKRRCVRKYFKRLERVILSLPYDKLKNFSMSLIVNPPRYKGRGRFLLRDLYERAYFDDVNFLDMACSVEYLKHFVKQQSGTFQSQSAGCMYPDELLCVAEKVFNQYSLEQCIDTLRPKQQLGFTFNHSVDILDSNFDKMRNIILESQKSFLVGLKETILDTGKAMLVMFCTASTVALLMRIVAGFSAAVVFKLLHWIYALVCGDGMKDEILKSHRVIQQGNENEVSIPFLPAMILNNIIAPAGNLLSNIWNDRQTDTVMRRIGYLGDPKIERGLERLTEWIHTCALSVINWFRITWLGLDPVEDISSEIAPVTAWASETDDIVKLYLSQNFAWTESNWSIMMNLYSRGLTLARQPIFIKHRAMIWKTVQILGNILEKFKLHQRSGSNIRNPPVTIYLTGGTGVGKSSITYPLAAEILKAISQKEQFAVDLKKCWKSLIYMRSAEQEFWDGYENQLVTVFDDFNQQADSASNPSIELFEIIRASNSFPYPLHMAELSQKANTYFTSKIIIVSSNMEKPKTQSLNFPDALQRRFDICIRVNRKKVDRQIISEKFDPNLYELELYSMSNNQPISEIGYKELVYMCAQEYFRRKSFVDSVDKYIQEQLEDDSVLQQSGRVFPQRDKYGQVVPMSYWDKVCFHTEKYLWGTVSSVFHPWMMLDAFRNQYDEWRYGASRWDDDSEKRYLFYQLNRCSDYFKLKKEELYQQWVKFKSEHPYLVKAGIMITVLATSLAFLKMYYSVSNSFDKKENVITPEAFAESYTPQQVKGVKAEAYTPVQIRGVKAEAYTPVQVKGVKVESDCVKEQGVKDINAAEILLSVARKNLYKMYESTRDTTIGHVLFLKGKVALMPKHYMTALLQAMKNDPEATVSFEAVLLKRSFSIKIYDMLKTKVDYESPDEGDGPVWSRDLMAVSVDTAIVHSDSTSFFASRASLYRVDATSVFLPILVNNDIKDSDRAIMMIRNAQGRSQLSRQEKLAVGDDDNPVLRYVRDAWVYNLDTRVSECGAPLIVRNTQINPGKICGIHIAGMQGTGTGYSTPVYLEDVICILKRFGEDKQFEQKIRIPLNEYPKEQCQVPQQCEFVRLGSVERPVAQPGKSKIEPSLCHAYIRQPQTKPCALRPVVVDGREFDPRAYRIGRLGNVPVPISEELISNSKNALVDEISTVVSAADDLKSANIRNVYSFEEAVLGIAGEPFVTSIKRNTSPGYPFVHMKGYETRKHFFGGKDEYDLTSFQCQHLKVRVEQIISEAKRGVVLDHIFMDTLKDERKPVHKAHKTRLFAAGPIDYLIACKMYFNPIVAVLQKNRNWCHVSVGTNPYSQDWDEIARCLLRKSKLMVAGDFEGFDASQHQRLLEAAGEVLISLSCKFCGTTDEDAKIMRVLLVSLFNSIHITGNEVYQWTHSLPSGHYLTAIINSIFVNLAFLCVWQLTFKVSYFSARMFYALCALVAYGDDHIVSIPESCIESFNQFTLPTLFKRIGLSYTMEDKDAVVTRPHRNISEITYLKRGFRWDEQQGKWYSPLSMDTILETPMWLHKCPDKRLQTIDNLEWALKELGLHSENEWNQWAPVLHRQGERLGHYTMLKEQFDARVACLSQNFEM